jgi:hypothetical protein
VEEGEVILYHFAEAQKGEVGPAQKGLSHASTAWEATGFRSAKWKSEIRGDSPNCPDRA